MIRMCSLCRKALNAARAGSLTLNDRHAHVECVEMALREPWSMTDATDDDLNAEWMRRHPNQQFTAFGGVTKSLIAERDEWKRRAEAAEMQLSASRALDFDGDHETGPGIAKRDMWPDTSHWVDPLDLLADDA